MRRSLVIAGLLAVTLGAGCVQTNPAKRPTTGSIRIEDNSIIIPPAQPVVLIKAGMTRVQVETLLDERSPAYPVKAFPGTFSSTYHKTFDGHIYYDANDRVTDVFPKSCLQVPKGPVSD